MNKPKPLLAAVTVYLVINTLAPTADADPTPSPVPYQPGGPGGPIIGVQPLPAICAVQPLACAMRYDPNTGTWQPPAGADQ